MAVVTTNLATQVQSRINNLTGTETLEQLLVLRKAADNLSLSLTAIETAISAKIAALDNTSPDDDLLIANRAASLFSEIAGKSFKPSFFSGPLQIPLGVSGDVLTITAPAGKRARLNGLISSSGSTPFVSISADGVPIVGPVTLGSTSALFIVANVVASSPAGTGAGVLPFVEGNQIIVSISSPSAQPINYSFSYGD